MTERQHDSNRTHLFVVRLWSESFDHGRLAWRGEVAHPDTSTRRYFARWQDLLEFLGATAGVPWDGQIDVEITMEVIDQEARED